MEPGTDQPPEGDPGRATGLIDRSVIDRLYRDQALPLRRFLLGVVRDPELAEDVAQAAFAKAIESAQGVAPEALKSWLFRVAYREAITIRRRQATQDSGRRRLAASSPDAIEADDRLIRVETVEAVREVLRGLPDEQLRVVSSRIYDGKTFAAIAEEQGLPLGTVLTRMRRALERLRRALGPIGE